MNTDERDTKRFSVVARTRMAVALVVAGCLALVGLAVTGQAATPERLEFVQVGHWVYNDAAQSAFHVDGSTSRVDARADVPGVASGSQVAQGDDSGYVVERNRITEFDKSTLSVEESKPPPAPETPFVLEIAGGPYLVYRNAGQIVRLGDPSATVPAGGPLSRPVATADGTVWVLRIDNGSICELPKGAAVLTCTAQLPPGHGGGLTLVGDRPVVLDMTGDSLHRVGPGGLGEALPLGIKLSPSAQVANSSVGDRLAIADPERNQLHLIDISGLDQDRPSAKPISVELSKGSRFNGPLSSSNVVAMVDETRGEVLTYDAAGKLKATTKVPNQGTAPRLAKGEDNRIYVDSSDGSHVLVVNGEDGTVVDVDVDKAANTQTAGAPPADPEPSGERPPPPPSQQRQQAPPVTQKAPPPVAKATPPGAPRKVSATAGDGSVKVSWSPAAENGARITGYRVSWTGGSTKLGGSSRGTTISGLANGTPYVVTVVAENSVGLGVGASAKAVVPGPANRPAGAPVVTANATAAGKVSVSWTQPDLRGGTLVHYLVSATGQGQRTLSATSTEFTGVTGTATVSVRAVTKFDSGSTLTGATGSRKVTVPVPSDPPTITISGVRVGTTGLIVSVNANGKGASATCQAEFNGALSTPKSCSGATTLNINNVAYVGAITVNATIKTTGGTGKDSWTGVPSAGGGAPGGVVPDRGPLGGGTPGGSVLWLGPIAMVGLRRRKEKELL
ncbi:fibronectin type III domain-containing protein [Amycolatopsis alba]|uniref:Fibronectin type III domain-containing protein n=1 Tax=Amycolatopsis alba DSM 44262 TaxID=1125972 RepID=A0A229RGT6_AMYAL|nr:fibronectin type III domain-containing protein [Amycolatopsis alba]OXM45614.1 fibronectin type III domain-containing protein [Amycolatopsis alba DSM 44262]